MSDNDTTEDTTIFVENPTRRDEDSDLKWLKTLQLGLVTFFSRHGRQASTAVLTVLLVAYTVYFVVCLIHSPAGATALAVLTSVCVILTLFDVCKRRHGRTIIACLQPLRNMASNISSHLYLDWWLYTASVIALIVYTCFVIKDVLQVRALCGYCIFVSLTLITSKHVTQIRWRTVVWGLGLQVLLTLLFLRVRPFFITAQLVSHTAGYFLRHSLRGAVIAFGNPLAFLHPLFMVATPVLIYTTAVAGLAAYVGLTPYVARKLAWVIKVFFNTSCAESFSLADDVFSGMMDYVTRFRPYVSRLTKSEFLTALVGAHSNLFGLMYAFLSVFWVNQRHVMIGAVAALPAGIAFSKINYPETQQTQFKTITDVDYDRRGKLNVCEALSKATLQGGRVAGCIIIQVISYMGVFELVDVIIRWFRLLAGVEFDLQALLSNMFMPFAYLIGVPTSETNRSAFIIGLSLVQNEIFAYIELSGLCLERQITERSAAITTVAICGFSSFGSMCIVTGVWSSKHPRKYREGIHMLYRVYLITHMACLTTACLVAVFYDEEIVREFETDLDLTYSWFRVGRLLSSIPSYKSVLSLLGL